MYKLRKLYLCGAVLASLCLLTASIEAATKTSRESSWKTFLYCDRQGRTGVCIPLLYTWQASVQVNYTATYDRNRKGNMVTIRSVDQSTWMPFAAKSPCNIHLGITVDVLENGRKQVATLRGTSWGSYIYAPSTLHYGRVSKPELRVFNPVFRVTAVAASTQCFNSPFTLSWVFTP